jgi:hypothetical protein
VYTSVGWLVDLAGDLIAGSRSVLAGASLCGEHRDNENITALIKFWGKMDSKTQTSKYQRLSKVKSGSVVLLDPLPLAETSEVIGFGLKRQAA